MSIHGVSPFMRAAREQAVVIGICVSEAMATTARHVLDAKAAAASALWHGFNL
jgi:hypothetical protein